jgi:NAD(P)-dependent dehydrogenase (short-subunit alcohol dehydrogenase family)
MSYAGKTAIVTGGASGIGRALSEELARRGATVIVADRQDDLAREVADGIAATSGKAKARPASLDVRDAEAFRELVQRVAREEGRLDLLFNNAGIGIGGELSHHELDDWKEICDVNLHGVVHGVQAAYPVMIAQGDGHIVNTASVAGLVAFGGLGAYNATKHAVVGLSKSLRVEGRDHGVRCSVLCPGVIDTPILRGGRYGRFRGMTEELLEKVWQLSKPFPAPELARQALDAVARNEGIIVRPRRWKIVWWLERVAPAATVAFAQLMQRRVREELSGVGPDEGLGVGQGEDARTAAESAAP